VLTRARRKARRNRSSPTASKIPTTQRPFPGSWTRSANSSPVVQYLANANRDYITTESFQFTADIAAVGPFGRGYRRVKFIFDISEGTPKIIYRQDLSRLGWRSGKARTTWVAKETP